MMKALFIALVFLANTACAQDTVKISGTIKNRLTDSVLISYNTNHIAYYPNEYTAHLDKQGNFSVKLPIPHGIYIETRITHGNKFAELILHDGDNLDMVIDADRFDSSVHYTGRGSVIQNFIAKHALALREMNWYAVKIKEAINKEPQDFLQTIAYHKKTEQDFLEENKTDLPASFIRYWNAWHEYYNYFIIQQYPRVREVVRLRKQTDTIPEINNTVMSAMPYAFNDSLVQVPPYLLYLTGVFGAKLRAAGFGYFRDDTANERRLEDSVNKLVYTVMPNKSAEYFVAQDIYGRARIQDLQKTRKQFASFKKRWPKSEYLPAVASQVVITERLAPGQPAPDFDIHTADGKSMKLSDLKGNVVYISFWATWCKQCKSEIFSWQKMRPLTKKQPVAFVYISIDNDTAAANQTIRNYQIDGLCTNAVGGWYSKEAQLYGVQSLPAYFLIDKKGKIAEQNALTPEHPTELMLQIGKLLK